MGWYVMGDHSSVAWCATHEEAEKIAKRLNYRGGKIYRVEPDIRTDGLRSEK